MMHTAGQCRQRDRCSVSTARFLLFNTVNGKQTLGHSACTISVSVVHRPPGSPLK